MSESKELLCSYINEYPNMLEIGDHVLVWCDEAYRPAKISSIQVEVGIGKVLKYFCTHSTASKHLQGFGLYFPNQVVKKPEGM